MKTEKELEKLRIEALKLTPILRSCWNCNSTHEHLRRASYLILCFGCGHYFFKGEDLTIVEEKI